MVCSSGLGAWPAGIHITSHQLLEPAGPGKDKPKSPKKRKAALSVSIPTRACLHIDKSLCRYNTIKYHIYICTLYTLYIVCIHICMYMYMICIYIYSNVRYVYMYSVSMLHESHGKDHIGANHQIHRACPTGGKVKPQRKRETYPGKEVVFTNQTWDVWLIYKLLTLSWFVHKSSQI